MAFGVGSLASVFTSTVAPVLSIAAVGYVLGRVRDVDVEPLNTVTLYVLLPALILHSLVTSPLGGGTALWLFVGIAAFTFVMLGLAAAVGRALGESGASLGALMLASAFPNVGNFGIPVSEFAFGEVGRSVAVLFVVGQQVLLYTVGVYVASRATGAGSRNAVERVFRLPLVYVVAFALGANALGVVPSPESTAMETLRLVGEASIPLFLLVLGVQLARASPRAALGRTAPAVGCKLLVAPLVATVIAMAIGFDSPDVARTFVLEAAAPVAITPLAVLIEFSADEPADGDISAPAYMGTVIFVTTLASVPVVTGLVAALRVGVPF